MKKLISVLIAALLLFGFVGPAMCFQLGHWAYQHLAKMEEYRVIGANSSSYTNYFADSAGNRDMLAGMIYASLFNGKNIPSLDGYTVAENFVDTSSAPYGLQANYLRKVGLLNGRGNSYYAPFQYLTRAEVAALLVTAKEQIDGQQITVYGGFIFPDVYTNHWAYEIILKAYAVGIIHGYPDGTFRPDQPVTIAEMATMVDLTFGNGAYYNMICSKFIGNSSSSHHHHSSSSSYDKPSISFSGSSSVEIHDTITITANEGDANISYIEYYWQGNSITRVSSRSVTVDVPDVLGSRTLNARAVDTNGYESGWETKNVTIYCNVPVEQPTTTSGNSSVEQPGSSPATPGSTSTTVTVEQPTTTTTSTTSVTVEQPTTTNTTTVTVESSNGCTIESPGSSAATAGD